MIAGSVRRWPDREQRNVERAVQDAEERLRGDHQHDPCKRLDAARGLPAGAEAETGRSSATVGTVSAIGTTSIRHSRPRVSKRPKKADETIPVTPDTANASPTSAGL
jgi:hypothetical protein